MENNTFYVTTPIYYTSGEPHLGHAYTSIAADIIARWNRIKGKDVFFLTGTDEHGQKVQKKAEESGMNPKEYVDSIIPHFKKQLDEMNVSYDYFIRTTYSHHKQFVQKMLQKAYDNGDIYKAFYDGLYCVDCEQYYSETDLIEGNICPVHKKEVERMSEENYFFRLSNYQDKLLDLYEKNEKFLSPKTISQETINRVKEGLQDISISRNKMSLTWGIELPFDSEHVTYVWFDALFNYISAIEYNDKLNYWPADVHIVGKDIMWFHKVYWPAFLMSCGYEMPKQVFAHGWWTVNGEKMGKSMGNVIDPLEVVENYGLDEFRYFVLSVGTFGEDQDFTYEKFADKINNELNNDFGNLVSRIHAMTNKYCEGVVPKCGEFNSIDEELINKFSNLYSNYSAFMDNLQYNRALEVIWELIRETNAYINEVAPWKENNQQRLDTIIAILVSIIRVLIPYIEPFMPGKIQRLKKQYYFTQKSQFDFQIIEEGHRLGEKDNLFTKIKLEDTKEKEVEKKGFSKLNLKVGKIIDVKQHPEADKLYIESIDVGEDEPRQIISGLKDYYLQEDLIGKKVIVVANLKPAKLRGVKSQGMVLLAENEQKEVGFLESQASVGTQLSVERVVANNEKKISVDEFFEIELFSQGDKVIYDNKTVKAQNTPITIENNIVGMIR